MKRKKICGKVCAAALSLACVLNTSVISNVAIAEGGVKFEFEDGDHPNSAAVDDAKASGGKYVYLEKNEEAISVNANVESAGMYDIYICYAAPYGNKIQNLVINGVDQGQISFTSEEWTEVKALTAKLNAGDNKITIQGSWGWTNFDYIRVESASLPDITGHDRTPCDAKATDSAKRLMAYLGDTYGKNVISGQQEIYNYGPHDFEYEFNYIKDKTGKLPAIRGFDFLNCANILYGSEDGTVDRMIDWVNNKKGIVTASWHVTVPKNFANYKVGDKNITWNDASYSVWTDDDNGTHTKPVSDFDTAKVTVEGTKENEYYMACLEALAEQIQKLQDADVPLIFRPLHEAEGSGGETGSWFWWGKEGSAVYKDIWKLTYKTLTEKYNLHNIIWEWNSYAYDTSANWYPGDEYVDLIAYDKYNCTVYLEENNWQPSLIHNDSGISGTFYNIVEKYNSKKMVAMAENDSIPTLDNLISEKAAWLYFCPWYDGGSDNINFLSNPLFNKVEDLTEIYQSDYCITLDELPDLKTYESGNVTPTDPTEPTDTTETTTTTMGTAICDYSAVVEFDDSPMKVGEKRKVRVYNPETGKTVGITFPDEIPEIPSEISIEYEEGSDTFYITALAPGDVSLEIRERSCAFPNRLNFTIEEGTNPTTTVSTDVTTTGTSNSEPVTTTTIDPSNETKIKVPDGVKATMFGDCNTDEQVNVADIVKLNLFLLNQEANPLSDVQIANADCMRDGYVDTQDSSTIMNYVAMIIKIEALGAVSGQ